MDLYPANTIITLMATDTSGNTSVCIADIEVLDTIKPTIDVDPMMLMVECDGAGNTAELQAWLNSQGGAMGSDNCGTFSWTYDLLSSLSDGCPGSNEQLYQFTLTDEFGNMVSDTATFKIKDTTPPMMMCCPDFTISLDQNGQAFLTVDSLDCGSTDICSDDSQLIRSISKENFNSDDIGPNDVVLTITDECGNTNTCTVVVTVSEMPVIGIAKRALAVTNNPDGTASVTYEINVENYGDVLLDSISVTDDLAATFAGCTVLSTETTSDEFIVNTDYDGQADTELLAGNNELGLGDKGSILLTVVIDNCATEGPFSNDAFASAMSPSGTVTMDQSQDGANPDPSGEGNPDEFESTVISIASNPVIGVAKNLVTSSLNDDGSYSITYEFNIENLGTVNLDSVQLTDDLASVFGAPCAVEVVTLTSDQFTINTAYDGVADFNLLDHSDMLAPAENGAVLLEILVTDCGTNFGPFDNQATVTANDPQGNEISDLSVDGTNTDPNGDGIPDEESITPVSFMGDGVIGIAKRLSEDPVLQPDGTYTFEYELRVQNYGDIDVNVMEIIDSLSVTFAMADDFEVVGLESEEFAVNADYDGTTEVNVIDDSQDNILAPGNQGAVRITVNVAPGEFEGPYNNTATVNGTNAFGVMVTDASVDGSNPDADGSGNPNNDMSPTPVLLPCYLNIICPDVPDTINVPNDPNWCQAAVDLPEFEFETCAGIDEVLLEYQINGVGADGVPVGTWIEGQPSNFQYLVGSSEVIVRVSVPARPDLGLDSCDHLITVASIQSSSLKMESTL